MSANPTRKGIWNPIWPSRGAAVLRLLLIVAVLLPFEWTVFALLVGDWKLNLTDPDREEPTRHLLEGAGIFAGAVSVIFLASLLPVFGRVHRFMNWLFSPRIVRRLAMALVWIFTAVVLIYAEEDWRGAHEWNHYRQRLEAEGAQLDFAAFIPKPIPDDQNFAATPLISEWFTQRTNTARWEDNFTRAAQFVSGSVFENTDDRRLTDLVAWDRAFKAARSGEPDAHNPLQSDQIDAASRAAAAPGVLEGLGDDTADLGALRAATDRLSARYPVVYDLANPWGILLPHVTRIKQTSRRLQLKASAELALGRSADALNDVKLLLYLADSVKPEPFLISYLVRVACVQLAIQPVWEGLAEHRWSEPQLRELQQRFQDDDFIADLKQPFDSERAAMVLTAGILQKKGVGLLMEIFGPGQPTSLDKKFANWVGGLVPSGWFYLEQLNYVKLCQLQLEGAFDPTTGRVYPSRIESNERNLERELSAGHANRIADGVLRHRLLASLLLPSLTHIPAKGAEAQVAADQAAIACALERFRLAHGTYPESLDALVPTFISHQPNDVITGKPYLYRRTGGEGFKIYSVGWNETDEGGTSGKSLFDERRGDWVWHYPAH